MWITSMYTSRFRSVRTLYYMDVDFYRYFIGRDDQSVNEKSDDFPH